MSADPSSNVSITQDEFNHFHNIDRKLFLRLVVDAGCEPTQATQVMAIFMWFENVVHDLTLVSKLLNCPNTLLTDLAIEASLVYTCIENHSFPLIARNNINTKYYDLPLTQKITRTDVTLHFLRENRVSIKPVVTNLINNICAKAFADIVQCLHQHQKAVSVREQMLYYNPMVQQVMSRVAPLQVKEGSWNWREGDGDNGGTDDVYDLAYSKEFINNELCEILSRVEMSGGGIDAACERGERDVSADDRTIFLTFSKGYPISESEIRDYFSRLILSLTKLSLNLSSISHFSLLGFLRVGTEPYFAL